MNKNVNRRKTLSYKIKLWFYKVTFRDMVDYVKKAVPFVVEFVMCALFFGLILLIPALFH